MKWKGILLLLLLAALLVWQRQTVGQILALLLLAATLAYLVTPLSRWLEKRVSKKWGAVLAFLLIVLGLGGLIALVVPLLGQQMMALAEQIPVIWEQTLEKLEELERFAAQAGIGPELIDQFAGEAAQVGGELVIAIRDGTAKMVQSLSGLGWMILSPVVAFYLVRDREALFNQLERMIPSRVRPFVLTMAAGARDALGVFVRSQLLVSLITGALTALGLLIVGLPTWLVMGVVMSICDLIPYFGPIIGAVPILMLSAGGGMGQVIKSLVVVVAAQQIESMLVAPRIMADSSDLHPAVVIVGLFAGGLMGGLAGLVFAMPLMMILRVVGQSYVDWKLYGYR